jgi:iron-sulfur cluster repair protein YtfE (RIC family)
MIGIGPKPTVTGAAGMLLECHARIRSFSKLAVQLATASPCEIGDAAERVHRYFTVALPLHIADEELSLAPRLRRFAPETAAALEVMEREHRVHEERLVRLCEFWRGDVTRLSSTLAEAELLQRGLEEHLLAEERAVLPALVRLPSGEELTLIDEMRGRRR